jgi:hypothetical protein
MELTSESVLSHKDTDHDDIRMAGASAPTDTVDASTVNELCEHKLRGLMLWGLGKDCDDEGCGPKGMPPHRDVVEIFQEVHPEGVDHAFTSKNFRCDS